MFFFKLGHMQFMYQTSCTLFTQNTFPKFCSETCHCLLISEGQLDTYIYVYTNLTTQYVVALTSLSQNEIRLFFSVLMQNPRHLK